MTFYNITHTGLNEILVVSNPTLDFDYSNIDLERLEAVAKIDQIDLSTAKLVSVNPNKSIAASVKWVNEVFGILEGCIDEITLKLNGVYLYRYLPNNRLSINKSFDNEVNQTIVSVDIYKQLHYSKKGMVLIRSSLTSVMDGNGNGGVSCTDIPIVYLQSVTSKFNTIIGYTNLTHDNLTEFEIKLTEYYLSKLLES